MPGFSILLPPAEGKVPGGNPFAPRMFDRGSSTFNYFSGFNPERRTLIAALHQTIEQGDGLAELFGVKHEYLEAAIEANRSVMDSPVMSALDRYSVGVMYKAMDFNNLPTGAQRRLLEHGVIFSGLFGLLRPDDLIPNYRLRMDATLQGVGKVAAYWREVLSPELNTLVKGRFVWNLLPKIHQDAWADAQTYAGMAQVRFFTVKDGERKPVTHGVKPLRGALINYIVREAVETPEMLFELDLNGYRYDADASTWDEDTGCGILALVNTP